MRKNTVEVFLNEEYGYKCWIWRPNMNEEEFSSWWQNLSESDIIKYYFNIKALPGTLKEYTEKNSGGTALPRERGDPKSHRPYYYCHFHDVDNSYISIGNETMRFYNRSKYDWKDHWFDHNLRKQKARFN
jgi:hypothetical protein